VANWTYTTNGPFGDGQYFLRIMPNGALNSGATVTLANGGGTFNQNAVVDNGFLQPAARQLRLPHSLTDTVRFVSRR
jgi:glucoamylase